MGSIGICQEVGFGNDTYEYGHRYCSKCEIYFMTTDISCPCWNRRL